MFYYDGIIYSASVVMELFSITLEIKKKIFASMSIVASICFVMIVTLNDDCQQT